MSHIFVGVLSKSLVELIKCRLREFIREPSAAVFVVTMPVMWMIILGFAIKGQDNGTRYVDFLVPGLAAFSIMTSSMFGVGMTIVVHRRENLLKRFLVTPMPRYEYLLSHIVSRLFILLSELASILIAAKLLFAFSLKGSLFDFAVISILGAAAFTTLGILCASRTTNTSTMMGITNLVMVPLMIVSGIWFSRANFPDWLTTLTAYSPLSALADGLRGVALEGKGLTLLGFESTILLVVCAVAALFAYRLFSWHGDRA
jgi:ABC-type multidrug transport system permease subunit